MRARSSARAGRCQVAHGREAQGRVPDQRRHVECRLRRRHCVAVGTHRRVAKRRGTEQVERRPGRVRHVRRERDAAVARHQRGDALGDLGQVGRVAQHDRIVMGVGVDEARCDDLTAAVDDGDLRQRHAVGQALAQAFAEARDAVADQQHVAGPRRPAAAVDDETAFEQGRRRAHRPSLPLRRGLPLPPPSQLCSEWLRTSMPCRCKAPRTACRRCTAGSPRRWATSTVRISIAVRWVR